MFELTFLTSWVYNVLCIIVFSILGTQIYHMRNNMIIQIDQTEENVQEANHPDAELFVKELEKWLLTDHHISSQDLSRDMVAHAMHTNHVTLSRILRQQKDMTLFQFIADTRLREAERLLLTTNMTIEEIYCTVGYQTRSTFSRAFQERNNCSASEWREKHQHPGA